MKVLVVTFMHVPWVSTDQTGIGRRFGTFLHALHQLSDDITLLHIVPRAMMEAAGPLDALSRSQSEFWGVPLRIALEPRQTRAKTAWSYYGAGVLDSAAQPTLSPYGGAELAEAVGRHLDQAPDLVFAHRLPAVLPILRSGRRPARMVFDVDDVEHRVLLRNTFSPPYEMGKAALLLQLPALMMLERRAVAASQLAFVCSETDRRYLNRLRFGAAVQVVPNARPVPAMPPGLVGQHTVLFLGDMKNTPNYLAAERMARTVWPLVRARVPDACLLIAGANSDRLPSASAGLKGVEFLGFIENLDALYARSRVVCCPILTGGGTRLKLVEAASYARPIVSTRIGAEGLDFTDGREALLRDDDAGFAAACGTLLQDDQLCLHLGAHARTAMAAAYDVNKVEARIVKMLRGLDQAPERSPSHSELA